MMIGPVPDAGAPTRGGVESACWALCDALADSGVEVIVADLSDRVEAPRTVTPRPGLTIVRIPRQRRLRLLTRAYRDLPRLRELAERFGPDLVHGQGLDSNGDAAIALRLPSVVTVHGMPLEEVGRQSGRTSDALRTRLLRTRMERVLEDADCVISISRYDERRVSALVRGVHATVPNAVRPEFFDVARETARPAGPVALYCGVAVERKNVSGLVRAWAKARSELGTGVLALAGPAPVGEQAEALEDACKLAPEGSVRAVGVLDSTDLCRQLAATDALCLFSWQETLPMVAAEAMAAGVAVIATDVGGVRELVSDGETGVLVPAGDEVALARALVGVLGESGRAARMGAAACRVADRFSATRVAQATIDLYDQVLSGRPR